MTADILREKFLSFFKARNHKIVESDSLVPKDDPTVLFTPAGMNQFKKEFMGFDSGFSRAATAQRCLRTDDLDKVGKTSAHHTFFEMLGNFSFGDYFKAEAIAWAWEFLTKELKMDAQKLWVSVYQDDDEAYKIWRENIKIPEKKIVRLGDKDNFWPAEAKTKGPNGPCGPCSEIFYDFGPAVGCGRQECDPSCSCGRFVEIWNLVFTQFNRKEDASLEPLPNKNIDTGMGLERLTAVMQGKQNNFETELFQPIIQEIRQACGAGVDLPGNKKLLYAVSDHLRAVVFSIYDGITPSNEGRGYIVRKIIRKSLLHLRSLGINKPFLNRLVGELAQIMQAPYPDLKERQEDIAQVILEEEKKFINTLEEAPKIFKAAFVGYELNKGLTKNEQEELGRIAFKLSDTYGIPFELTNAYLGEFSCQASTESFNRAREEQQERSKLGSAMKGDVFGTKGLGLKIKETKFTGYLQDSCSAEILVILKNSQEIKETIAGDDLEIVLDQSPFYAESGGQVGDTGKISVGKNVFEVHDTQKIDNVILHIGKVSTGVFKKGDKVIAQIDTARRLQIARNHTATHILQAALREVLGSHVQQQGSLVNAERFRFDFTHFKALSKEEIARVEEVANAYVAKNQKVNCKEMAFAEAKKSGALAFFEEKYGENVRVVSIGDVSKELCGGTHLDEIGKIELIKVTSEGSVASGIRRIEAVTADYAKQFTQEAGEKAQAEALKRKRLEELKNQEKQRSAKIINSLSDILPKVLQKGVQIGNIHAIFSLEDNLDIAALRVLADKLKEKAPSALIALGSQNQHEKKAYLVVAVTPDLLGRGIDAGALIRQVAPLIGGSGGGRPDFAQAGGANPENFTLAFEKLSAIIKSLQEGKG